MAHVASERFVIRSFTAAGTADLGGVQVQPRGNLGGANLVAQATGNWEASILADNFGDGGFVDVTSMFTGAATFKTGATFARVAGYMPWALRINVTSVQAANSVRFAAGF